MFGTANAYLGLRVGLTISASIPAAVMTVAVFRVLRRPGTILEAIRSAVNDRIGIEPEGGSALRTVSGWPAGTAQGWYSFAACPARNFRL